MAKAQSKRVESVGWLFWGVGAAIVVGPAIYLMSKIVLEGTPLYYNIGTGVIIAVIVSGVVTASVNGVLDRSAKKRRAAERKAERKKTKK